MNILIIGASRGLGRGLTEAFAGTGANVIATVRNRHSMCSEHTQRVKTFILDITESDSGLVLKQKCGPLGFDALIICAGILGPDHQDVTMLTGEELNMLFLTNSVAPVRLAKNLMSMIRPGGVIAFLSSKMASFELNFSGEMELYRASKSALNSLARSFAVSTALPANRGVLLLHPGWVQTDMGGENAPVSLQDSVTGLTHLILASLDNPSCKFIDYLGNTLPT